MESVNILGVRVDLVGVDEVLTKIQEFISCDRRALIAHVHVMGLNIACENEWFRHFLNGADLVYCDGMGVKLGARLLGYHIPYRLTLADWMWQFAEMAEEQGFSFYLLGNPPGVVEKTTARLLERFSRLDIKGGHHGFFDKAPGSLENEVVLEKINTARPDILMVGFGMPAQERWLMENRDSLDVKLAITVGALFEYLSEDLQRGPEWMVGNYLEWLYRSLSEPKRYLKRYLRDNPIFLYRILKQRYAAKKTRFIKPRVGE